MTTGLKVALELLGTGRKQAWALTKTLESRGARSVRFLPSQEDGLLRYAVGFSRKSRSEILCRGRPFSFPTSSVKSLGSMSVVTSEKLGWRTTGIAVTSN